MSEEAVGQALAAAERVAGVLSRRGVASVLIGAAAMAVHGYPRATLDLDLATVDAPQDVLRSVAEELCAEGLAAEYRAPDASDPLGGVLRVEVDEALSIDVVNFVNPFTGAGRRLA